MGGYPEAAKAAGFLTPVGCHTWRATGITIYLENDGRLEHAQQMAGHESPACSIWTHSSPSGDKVTTTAFQRVCRHGKVFSAGFLEGTPHVSNGCRSDRHKKFERLNQSIQNESGQNNGSQI